MDIASAAQGYYPSNGPTTPVDVGEEVEILTGELVIRNSDGFAVPGANTAGAHLLGVARMDADNSDGANGDKEVVVDVAGAHLDVIHDGGSLNAGSHDAIVYVSGRRNVAASGNVIAGRIVKVLSATRCRIALLPQQHVDFDT
jgi:hypothetical protein